MYSLKWKINWHPQSETTIHPADLFFSDPFVAIRKQKDRVVGDGVLMTMNWTVDSEMVNVMVNRV